MDFVAITLFLFFYYVRPQDWISLVAQTHLVMVTMAFAIIATLLRERGFSLRQLFKTPHDWIMLLYFIWIVGTAGSATGVIETWSAVYAYLFYYWVTVQALSSVERIQRFL